MVRGKRVWVGGEAPGPFRKPAGGYLADANSGTLLGLLLDSLPALSGPRNPKLSVEEAEEAIAIMDARAAEEKRQGKGF